MNPALIYKRLPQFVLRLLGIDRLGRLYIERNGWPLSGVLTGYRMTGRGVGSYLEGAYEPDVCRVIVQTVRPGWVCVDVGAHNGYFTLLLAKLVGETGRVVAFEAHPDNAATVRRNVALNHLQARVRVEDMAISDGTCDRVRLFPGRDHSSSEWNIVGHDVEGKKKQPELEVLATSLDTYFPAGSRIDFVKMDIEGAEAQALAGMRRVLQESQPAVLVEFHDAAGWAGREELLNAGYALYDVSNGQWLDPDRDVDRVYHCLAVPQERLADMSL